jgi:N-acetylneuraminic acid mutarotase
MIVWGGSDAWGPARTGGLYDPATNSWTPTTTWWAPYHRALHTAVWLGSRMVVWGGAYWSDPWDPDSYVYFNDGFEYDPAANAWQQLTATSAPSQRSRHTAVSYVAGWPFTYKHMIIWGGFNPAAGGLGYLGNGGRYSAQIYKK